VHANNEAKGDPEIESVADQIKLVDAFHSAKQEAQHPTMRTAEERAIDQVKDSLQITSVADQIELADGFHRSGQEVQEPITPTANDITDSMLEKSEALLDLVISLNLDSRPAFLGKDDDIHSECTKSLVSSLSTRTLLHSISQKALANPDTVEVPIKLLEMIGDMWKKQRASQTASDTDVNAQHRRRSGEANLASLAAKVEVNPDDFISRGQSCASTSTASSPRMTSESEGSSSSDACYATSLKSVEAPVSLSGAPIKQAHASPRLHVAAQVMYPQTYVSISALPNAGGGQCMTPRCPPPLFNGRPQVAYSSPAVSVTAHVQPSQINILNSATLIQTSVRTEISLLY
jgi:hypothetical protein